MANQHRAQDIHEEEIRHHDVAYDRTDLGSRRIYAVLIGFAVFTVLVCIVSWGILRYLGDFRLTSPPAGPVNVARTAVLPEGDPALRFPTPVLQPDPVGDLNKSRAAERVLLETYGWVDQQQGVVRIPIGRAMDLIAERGLPVRPNAGLPYSQSYGSAPPLGGGQAPLPAPSPARMETSSPGNTLPPADGARRNPEQNQTGGRRPAGHGERH